MLVATGASSSKVLDDVQDPAGFGDERVAERDRVEWRRHAPRNAWTECHAPHVPPPQARVVRRAGRAPPIHRGRRDTYGEPVEDGRRRLARVDPQDPEAHDRGVDRATARRVPVSELHHDAIDHWQLRSSRESPPREQRQSGERGEGNDDARNAPDTAVPCGAFSPARHGRRVYDALTVAAALSALGRAP